MKLKRLRVEVVPCGRSNSRDESELDITVWTENASAKKSVIITDDDFSCYFDVIMKNVMYEIKKFIKEGANQFGKEEG